jgi:hypothetical protein
MMTAFLCISGIGSLISSRRNGSPRVLVLLATSVIVFVVAGYALIVPDLLARLLSTPLMWCVVVSVILAAPLALFVGWGVPPDSDLIAPQERACGGLKLITLDGRRYCSVLGISALTKNPAKGEIL